MEIPFIVKVLLFLILSKESCGQNIDSICFPFY